MNLDHISPGFGHWFAGFTDGEGNFDIKPTATGSYICRFTIGLRADDLPVLEEIRDTLQLGTIRLQTNQVTTTQARYSIDRKAECAQLVEFFAAYPLRAKKAGDLTVWRQAVHCWLKVQARHKHDWTEIDSLRTQLREGRRAPLLSAA